MSDAFKDAGPGERSVYDRTGLPEVAAIARMAAMSDEELIARLRLGPEYVYRFVDTDHVAADRIADLMAELAEATYYIDCEFDGHDGPLLSIAMVRGDGYSLHVTVAKEAHDPWVIANVVPFMSEHRADKAYVANLNDVGGALRNFMGDCQNPTIIADSPVDIGRFCRAISTGPDGGWASADYPGMTFIIRNVACYPTTLQGAVQHNAWWDAMALRAALAKIKEQTK